MDIWEGGVTNDKLSNGNILSGRKKEENDLVTMTDRSLLNWPSFIEGIYLYYWYTSHVHFRCHPPVLLFNLSPSLAPPFFLYQAPPFSQKLSLFFSWRIALFYPLSIFSLWWRARREAQVSLKRTSSLSWAREESVAMGTVSMAWKGAVANKTILV